MKTKKLTTRSYFACRIFLGLFCAALLLAGLSACSPKPPCQIDLRQPKKPPKPKPKKMIQVTRLQMQNFWICQLKSQGVGIIHVGDRWKLIFPSDDLFENESSIINPNYFSTLNIAANFMRSFSTINVKVSAYSDNVDSELSEKSGSLKEELTAMQAQSLVKYLTKACINARLIYAIGKDGQHPIAWNGSEAGRQMNRRVEVVFRVYHNDTAWY